MRSCAARKPRRCRLTIPRLIVFAYLLLIHLSQSLDDGLMTPEGHGILRVTEKPVSREHMLPASTWIARHCGAQLVAPQIEFICHNNLVNLAPRERADTHELVTWVLPGRYDQRTAMRSSVCECEGRRGHIHLAVSHKYVAVATKASEALVLVFIGIVRIQEAAVAEHEVEHRVAIAIGFFRIPAKDVIDPPSVCSPRGS
jgi:hypothetical protein